MKRYLIAAATLIVAVLFCLGNLSAQTVHPVSAGDNTLNDAINAAADEDIIELVDSGGLYTYSLSDKMYIDKTLTIRAAEELAKKPVVKNIRVGSTSTRIFEIRKGGNLTLIGLDLDGSDDTGAAYSKNCVRSEDIKAEADTFRFKLYIEDCILHNTTEAMVKCHYWTIVDEIVMKNCIINSSGKEGILLYESSGLGPVVDYAEFENCTFYDIIREAIKSEGNDPVMRINHCTFDNCGGSSKRMVYPRDANDAQIKNSIFTNNTYSSFVKLYGTSSFINNLFFNVTSISKDGDNVTVSDTVRADPLYTDAANGDFTLQDGSPALGAADDGFALGDLRWDPNAQGPRVHRVNAGENTLIDAINAADEGDIIELVDSGGLYTYSTNDKMYITKTLTIRAKQGLAQRPVVKNIRPASTSTRIFEIRKGGNLRLIGLNLDGRDDAGAAYNKNIIRSEDVSAEADSFRFKLLIEDCILQYTTQPQIKCHQWTIVDSIVIKNSIIHSSGREGVLLYESSGLGPGVDYAEFENCTFYNITREAIKSEGNDPVMRINHCTFDNVGGSSKRMVYPKEANDVQIKNSIFTNNTYSSFVKLYGNSSFTNNLFFNVTGISRDGDNITVSDTLRADPMYKDAVNGDFRLANASPARGAADDGRALGDLRWEADPDAFYLTIITVGNGIVTLDPPGGIYAPGTVVTMTANPGPGFGFANWAGNLFPPNANPVNITMNADETVTCTFEDLSVKYKLTVDTLGLGQVTLDPQPDDDGKYGEGTAVTLTAVPRPNWQFVEWTGDVTGTINPVVANIDSNMNITAVFASVFTQFSLTLQTQGMGEIMVEPEPIIATYDSGAVVTLTAEPEIGWQFDGWAGGLTGTTSPDQILMDSDKTVTAIFAEIAVANRTMEIDTTWDLKDAVDFANNNSNVDTLILVTSGGVYTSRYTSDVTVTAPLTIKGKMSLEAKPIITNSDPEKNNLDIFRVFDDFNLWNVILDAGHMVSHGMKYGIRLRHYTNTKVKDRTNIHVNGVEFINFFEDKDPKKDGHAFKIDVDIVAGLVLFENCKFAHFGYEAIRISDTEKWQTDRALDTLIVRNCTFTDIDAECVRYYSDANTETPDSPVILEHITINNSATRVFYLKNSGGATVRDIIIANSRQSGHGRDDDLMEAQGTGSTVSHIDTFKVKPVPIEAPKGGIVDPATIYGFDPMFEDPVNMNYTLLQGSPAYSKAHDGLALGDLNWAVHQPTYVVEELFELPTEFELSQNFPNPFNPTTEIHYALPKNSNVTLTVFNMIGQRIRVLVEGEKEAGFYHVVWDAKNDRGEQVSSGMYFYRIDTEGFHRTLKMLLLK